MQNLDQLDGALSYSVFVDAVRGRLDALTEFVFLEWAEDGEEWPADRQTAALDRVRGLVADVQVELDRAAGIGAEADMLTR